MPLSPARKYRDTPALMADAYGQFKTLYEQERKRREEAEMRLADALAKVTFLVALNVRLVRGWLRG